MTTTAHAAGRTTPVEEMTPGEGTTHMTGVTKEIGATAGTAVIGVATETLTHVVREEIGEDPGTVARETGATIVPAKATPTTIAWQLWN